MKTKPILILSLVGLSTFTSCKDDELPGDQGNTDSTPVPNGYSLLWADEFSGNDIDPSIWTYELGDGTAYGLPPGWGNDEKQLYTDASDNAYLTMHDGEDVLAITALKSGDDYSSAKLTTQGLKSILFGRIDIRAKVPSGNGLWPALWMLGENRNIIDWPGCGEIDIMEVLGKDPSKMYTTLHYVATDNKKGELQKEHQLAAGALFSDDYHVYSIEWTPSKIQYLLDGSPVYEELIQSDMKEFLRPHYFIMNLAVGGYWPGDPDPSTSFPASLYIDYVRCYSIDGLNIPTPPPLDTNEERLGPILDTNLANAAIKDDFTDFGPLSITPYGAGGEPALRLSDTAVDGSHSLVFDFPGGNWGGAYIELDAPKDLSAYSSLNFSLRKPASLHDAEIKLEGVGNNAIVMLKDYTGVPTSNGFEEYSIPLSDFSGVNFSELRIPFAMWNAMDLNQNFSPATVYVDKIYFN